MEIGTLEITGESYALEGEARIGPFDNGLPVEGKATLGARNLSAFSGLAGRPLGGQAALSVEGAGDVLAGAFDLNVSGTTENLAVGDRAAGPAS